jgi:hypothetical protein
MDNKQFWHKNVTHTGRRNKGQQAINTYMYLTQHSTLMCIPYKYFGIKHRADPRLAIGLERMVRMLLLQQHLMMQGCQMIHGSIHVYQVRMTNRGLLLVRTHK